MPARRAAINVTHACICLLALVVAGMTHMHACVQPTWMLLRMCQIRLQNSTCHHMASCSAVIATHDSKLCYLFNVLHAHMAATLLCVLLPDALGAHIIKTWCLLEAVLYKGLCAQQHTVQFYGTVAATPLLLQDANVLNTAAGVEQKVFTCLFSGAWRSMPPQPRASHLVMSIAWHGIAVCQQLLHCRVTYCMSSNHRKSSSSRSAMESVI